MQRNFSKTCENNVGALPPHLVPRSQTHVHRDWCHQEGEISPCPVTSVPKNSRARLGLSYARLLLLLNKTFGGMCPCAPCAPSYGSAAYYLITILNGLNTNIHSHAQPPLSCTCIHMFDHVQIVRQNHLFVRLKHSYLQYFSLEMLFLWSCHEYLTIEISSTVWGRLNEVLKQCYTRTLWKY
jgi:hypothetical protein